MLCTIDVPERVAVQPYHQMRIAGDKRADRRLVD